MGFLLRVACNILMLMSGGKDASEASEANVHRPPPPPTPPVEAQPLRPVTYSVADLIIPDDQVPLVVCRFLAEETGGCPKCQRGQTQESALIELITRTIVPGSWEGCGGQGTIQFFPLGLALVINQTPEVHAQIASLLKTLRRAQDEQDKEYVLAIKVHEISDDGKPRVTAMPRVTVFQGRWFSVFTGKTVALKDGTIQDLVDVPAFNQVVAHKGAAGPEPDEVQIGLSIRGKIAKLSGRRVRLDLVLQKNELDSASRDDISVIGSYLRTSQRLLPGQTIEQVLQEDQQGEPSVWLEITVSEGRNN